MKVHQTADGQLCRCAWCAPRLEAFRERRLEHSAAQDGRDAFVMEEAQTFRARGEFGPLRAGGHDTGGQQLYHGPAGRDGSAPAVHSVEFA
jgi:predicted alpha/beta-hydrolase family hydrolase